MHSVENYYQSCSYPQMENMDSDYGTSCSTSTTCSGNISMLSARTGSKKMVPVPNANKTEVPNGTEILVLYITIDKK